MRHADVEMMPSREHSQRVLLPGRLCVKARSLLLRVVEKERCGQAVPDGIRFHLVAEERVQIFPRAVSVDSWEGALNKEGTN